MCEAFEDVTSMPGLWSNYEKEAHPNFGLASGGGAAVTPLTTVPQDQAGYLVIANISKKDNIKRLISLAVAYGVEHVLIGESRRPTESRLESSSWQRRRSNSDTLYRSR